MTAREKADRIYWFTGFIICAVGIIIFLSGGLYGLNHDSSSYFILRPVLIRMFLGAFIGCVGIALFEQADSDRGSGK